MRLGGGDSRHSSASGDNDLCHVCQLGLKQTEIEKLYRVEVNK